MESKELQTPPGWGEDTISSFMDQAIKNTFASFNNLKKEYNILEEINSIFEVLRNNAIPDYDSLKPWFLFDSHSSFLCATRLAMSGHFSETFMVLRGCLERALYGFYIHHNKDLNLTWLKRHNDEESKKIVKKEFQIGKLITLLKDKNDIIGQRAKELYDLTIDYGAHPNEKAFSSKMEIDNIKDKKIFRFLYLVEDELRYRMLMSVTINAGLCSLDVFRLIYKERFDILGLSDRLDKLNLLVYR